MQSDVTKINGRWEYTHAISAGDHVNIPVNIYDDMIRDLSNPNSCSGYCHHAKRFEAFTCSCGCCKGTVRAVNQ